jgi:ATP-binding cassette subfamily B multidrug efflux pump
VPAGGTLAIVGHTGSGKSTMADLIGRLFDATPGEVRIDGVPIRRIAWRLRSQLGFVPQDVFLFSDSIRNNIAFRLGLAVGSEFASEPARNAPIHRQEHRRQRARVRFHSSSC